MTCVDAAGLFASLHDHYDCHDHDHDHNHFNDYHWVLLSRLQDSLGDLGSHILMHFFWTISSVLQVLKQPKGWLVPIRWPMFSYKKRRHSQHQWHHVIEDQGSSRFVLPFHGNSQSFWRRSKEVRRGLQALDKDGSGVGCVQTRVFFVWWLVPSWLKGCSVDCFHWFQLHGLIPWPR